MALDEIAMNVNPFGGKVPEEFRQQSQRIQEIEGVDNSVVEGALMQFATGRSIGYRNRPPLTPGQIEMFLQRIIELYPDLDIVCENTGRFISDLIMGSCTGLGYKDFTINPMGYKMKDLLTSMYLENAIKVDILGDCGCDCARKVENLHVSISGDCSFRFAYEAKRCSFTVKGKVGDESAKHADLCDFKVYKDVGTLFGTWSDDSRFTIMGNAGMSCGYQAKNCMFRIYGDCGRNLGWKAIDSIFMLHGDFDSDPLYAARGCTFLTPNRDTYLKAMKTKSLSGSRIELVELDPKGDNGAGE